MITGKLTH